MPRGGGLSANVRLSFMTWRTTALPFALVLAGSLLLASDEPNLTDQYRETADKLIRAALADREGYDRLAYLCYRIGNRLSGSVGLERAIAWSVEQMKAVGLSNVQVIPTKVPHWVRNSESAKMITPVERPLHMLGLGMSIGTPPGGITADTVVVSNFDELAKLGRDKVQGKIVVYNYLFTNYGSGPELSIKRRLAGGGGGGGSGVCGQPLRWRCSSRTRAPWNTTPSSRRFPPRRLLRRLVYAGALLQ